MANDFSGDSRCKAVFRFESGALTADSKGSNTLTMRNTPVADTGDYREGAACVDIEKDSSQGFYIADASLDSGFPLKSGDATKKMTLCFWVKFETVAGAAQFQTIVSKWNYNVNLTYELQTYNNYLRLSLATGATSFTSWDIFTPTTGRWYHVAITLSMASNYGPVQARIYDASTGIITNYYYYRYDPLYVGSSNTNIGCTESSGSPTSYFDGKLDEIVFFNDVLEEWEIDRIRCGTYDGVNNRQAVDNLLLIVAYKEPPPGQFIADADVSVSLAPSGTLYVAEYTKDAAVTVALGLSQTITLFQGPNEFIADAAVTVSFTPEATTIEVHAADAAVTVILDPSQTQASCTVFQADAPITIEILPDATTRMPILGWDYKSGYGMVDITDLGDPPPFWSPTSNLEIELDPTAFSYGLYAEISHEAEGGILLGGEPSYAIRRPHTYVEEARGGVKVGGAGGVAVDRGKILSFVAVGGLEVSGTAKVKWIGGVATLPIISVVGKKGVVVGGDPAVTFIIPEDSFFSHVATGGVKVGGPLRYPEVVVYRPEIESVIISVVGQGGVEVGDSSCLFVLVPPIVTIVSEPVSVVVFGAGGAVFIRPLEFQDQGEGGAQVGEFPGADDAETWALSGISKEPSFYTNFPFNSYAEDGLRVLAAAEDGIYQLGGADDAGADIHTGVRVATNFGKDVKKRLRSIYCGLSGPDTEVRVESEGKVCYAPWDRDRFSVDTNIMGREITIDVAEFEELAQFEVTPLEIAR